MAFYSVRQRRDNRALPLYVGIDADGTSNDWIGNIDEPKIYPFARSAAQVIEDMNAGHPAPGSPVGTPVGWWKFNEGAENTCSGGTNDACNSGAGGTTLDGTSTADRTNSGKYSRALDFNGTDDLVSITNSTGIDLNDNLTNFTFSAWVNADSDGEGDTGEIFAKSTNNYFRTDSQSGSNLDLECNLDRTTDTNVNITTAFAISTWAYVSCSWDGTIMRVYVNGLERGSSSAGSGAIANDAAALRIGGTNAFEGRIDEFKVYNNALTASQITLDMNDGKAQVLGALSDNSTAGQVQAESQEYCIPGDSTTCTVPVARWDLEEGSGTTAFDRSGNANTGTITAGAGSYKKGKIGKSYEFDNADTLINAGSGTTLDGLPAAGMTIEAWIYPESAGENSLGFIMAKNVGTTPSAGWILRLNNTTSLTFTIDGSTDLVRTTDTSLITQNAWNHVAFSWDGVMTTAATADIYINGKEATYATTTDGASRVSDNSSTFFIGNDSTSARTFDGFIDNVRVFNYARTPGQIAWDYNNGKPLAHYKIDECQGTTINDSSGNSYTGTLTNAIAGTCTTSGAWFNGVTGKRNYSVDLDTDDYIQVSDTANLRFDAATADFSLFAWVKRASNGEMNVISKEDADNDGYRLQFTSSNVVRCSVDAIDIDSTLTITDTNWHLIGCTIDRDGNGQIYLDGQPNGTAIAISSEVMANTANLRIGARAYTAANYLDGLIDDTKIYNYAITATQVKSLFNEGATRYGPVTGAP